MDERKRPEWQELCAAAAAEPDSRKLADLVQQIIKALDERRDGFMRPEHLEECSQR
jgi:hypothetical protein